VHRQARVQRAGRLVQLSRQPDPLPSPHDVQVVDRHRETAGNGAQQLHITIGQGLDHLEGDAFPVDMPGQCEIRLVFKTGEPEFEGLGAECAPGKGDDAGDRPVGLRSTTIFESDPLPHSHRLLIVLLRGVIMLPILSLPMLSRSQGQQVLQRHIPLDSKVQRQPALEQSDASLQLLVGAPVGSPPADQVAAARQSIEERRPTGI